MKNASDDYSIINSYEKEYNEIDLSEAFPEELNISVDADADKAENAEEDKSSVDLNGTAILEMSVSLDDSDSTADSEVIPPLEEESQVEIGIKMEEGEITDGDGITERRDADEIGGDSNMSVTLDYSLPDKPTNNMHPFRETLSEFEMLAKAGLLIQGSNFSFCLWGIV